MSESDIEYNILAEVDATELFSDDNVNWRFCKEQGNFAHRDDDACEFIVHIGSDDYASSVIIKMKAFGCTEAFINTYERAWHAGATRVLFYV